MPLTAAPGLPEPQRPGVTVVPGHEAATGITAAARRHPLSMLSVGVFLYATGPVFVQASSLSGSQFSLWRLWFGVPVLAGLAFAQLRFGRQRLQRRGLLWAVAAGLLFGSHQVLFMSAIKLTTVTDVVLMNTLAPIVVAVVAIPMFGERPGPAFRLWSLLAMTGAAVVVVGGASGPQGEPAGMAMAAANIVAFATFFLVAKKSRDDIPVFPFLAGTMIVAAVGVTGFVALTGGPSSLPAGRDLVFVLCVALGPGTLGHFVSTWPLRWVRANVPPVMRLAQPFISGLLAWTFLGETVTAAHVAGGAATIAGACGAVLSPSGRRFAMERNAPG